MKSDKVDLEPKEAEQQNQLDKYLWLGFPIIFLIWLGYCWFGYRLYPDDLGADRSFDRVNALFSGLAFWGVIWAILLQKRELSFQRRELALTRQEVRGQKEQLEAQNLTMQQQRFENTFFSLLNLFLGVIGSMEVTDARGVRFRGRECFTLFYDDFQREYTNVQGTTQSADLKALCIAAYDRFANYRQVAVGHYFRTFYNIVKFIDNSPIEDKQPYINILRAQLSSSELNLLFYNCLSNYGNQKFLPYVEQFGLLENMLVSNLARQDHKDLYKESAFKSQL
jgi:hypothetical protein